MLRLSVLLLAVSLSACAAAQPAPRSARVVTVVPAGAAVVPHRSTRDHVADGRHDRARSGRTVVAVAPPAGLVVRRLPRGAVAFHHRGVRHHRAGGVDYRRTGRGYAVVRL